MRARTLVVLFVIGLVAVGVAVAGLDRYRSVQLAGEFEIPMRETDARGYATLRLSQDEQELDYELDREEDRERRPGPYPPRRRRPSTGRS